MTSSKGMATTKRNKWSIILSHFSEIVFILIWWPAVYCFYFREAEGPGLVLVVLSVGGRLHAAH